MDRMLSGEHPLERNISGSWLAWFPVWSTTRIEAGKFAGRSATNADSAATPPSGTPTATKRPIAVAQVAAALLLSFREGYAWRPARRTAGGGLAGQTSLSASQ